MTMPTTIVGCLWATLAATVVSVAAAETNSARMVPQPRVRLDYAKISEAESLAQPRAGAAEAEAGAAVVMAPLVVNEAALPAGPKREPLPTGAFSPIRGGLLYEGEVGPVRVEFGVRPYFDLMESEFSPQRQRVDWEFLRIKW